MKDLNHLQDSDNRDDLTQKRTLAACSNGLTAAIPQTWNLTVIEHNCEKTNVKQDGPKSDILQAHILVATIPQASVSVR